MKILDPIRRADIPESGSLPADGSIPYQSTLPDPDPLVKSFWRRLLVLHIDAFLRVNEGAAYPIEFQNNRLASLYRFTAERGRQANIGGPNRDLGLTALVRGNTTYVVKKVVD